MALLFKIEGLKVFPKPETLLISPFKEIWQRDKSKDKGKALKEFSYIEFYSSMKKSNPFRHLEPEVKHKALENKLFAGKKYLPDKLVKIAIQDMERYQTAASSTYSIWKDALHAATTLSSFLRTVNLNERTKQGTPVYRPSEVKKMIDDIHETISKLKDMENIVFDELEKNFRILGNKEISYFSDPDNVKELMK